MIFRISKREFYIFYHQKNYTRQEIAKKYKITLYCTNEYIKNYNLKKRHLPRIKKKELYKLLYIEKFSTKKISKQYNISINLVRWYMKKYGFQPLAHWQELNLPVKLTKIQIEYLIGNILGDGWIHKHKGQGRGRFEIEQAYIKKDYIQWLHQIYSPFSLPIYKRNKKLYYKGNFKKHLSCGFYTHQHPSFDFWYNLFYPKRKKIIPNNIETLLTRRSLALWWADDGSYRTKTGECNLHTQGFDFKGVKKLKKILDVKFNIKVHLHKQRGRTGYKMYILAQSRLEFFKLIIPILNKIHSIQYKLPVGNI